MADLVKKFDADGDGKLAPEERDAARAALMVELDADADGAVSPAEFEAWHQRVAGPGGKPPARSGGPMWRQNLEYNKDRFDRDHDGELSEDELRQMNQELGLSLPAR